MSDPVVSEKAEVSSTSSVEKAPANLEETTKEANNVYKSDADVALQLLEAAGGNLGVIDEVTKARLLRRVDLYIMPLICTVYFLQYIDKISISYGSVMGMRADTHLVGDQFNWVSSIFFFGQLIAAFPTVRVLQYFPLAKYVSVNVIIWGICLACIAACTNFAGLMVCRFFLGMLEAAVVPAWVLFTSQWYRKEDQAFRVGIWFSMCGFAQMFGGFVAYGIATHVGADPSAKLAGWQIIYLFLGLITIVVGILFFFILPDSPETASFLSAEQKAQHVELLRTNVQGIGSNVFKWNQFREALTDINTWLFAFWVFAANVPNSVATSFGNILVTGLGYSPTESLLLVTPLGAYEVVVLIGVTWLAMKTDQRLWCCIVAHIPTLVGAVLFASTGKVPALIGYYLQGGIPIGWTTILGLTSTNVAGSTKKVTVAIIQTIAYCVGNIISPQTFPSSDGPNYLPAKISICVIYALCIVDLWLIRFVAVRENRRRDQLKAAAPENHVVLKNHEFMDLTDRENLEFRYSV